MGLMLRVVNMCKKFSSQTALENISLDIKKGEFFSLLGPSGCGKTTLLRIIAGFEQACSGELYWDDQRVDTIRPQNRPFNMVFQRYGLFPHMSVYENVAFGLKIKKVEPSSLKKRAEEALEMVGLSGFKERAPETLSGGQAQRVALARALVNEPKILLLDEPLSALDLKMREKMQSELRSLQRRLGITFILVTHDQEEAFALSDRIAVMNSGVVEQVSTPQELFRNPQTHFVAQFVGSMGSAIGTGAPLANSKNECEVFLSSRTRVKGKGSVLLDSDCEAFVRPDRIKLEGHQKENCEENQVLVTIQNIAYRGHYYEIFLNAPSVQLRAQVLSHEMKSEFHVGQSVTCYFAPEDTFIFSRPKA